jgi:hypothetical protein
MTAPTTIPDAIVDLDEIPTIKRRANGPNGPFPVVDSRGRFWTAERIQGFWHGVGYDAMAKALEKDGRQPYAFDHAFLRLGEILLSVAAGEFVDLAAKGGRAGMAQAALGYWRDVATVASRESEDPDDIQDIRIALETEALSWTVVRGVPLGLLDAIAEGLLIGVEERRWTHVKTTGRATAPKHAHRHDLRKEPIAS